MANLPPEGATEGDKASTGKSVDDKVRAGEEGRKRGNVLTVEEVDSLLHRAISIDQVIAVVSGSLLTENQNPSVGGSEAGRVLDPRVERDIRMIEGKALESGNVLHEARRKHRRC